ncbi:MAG: DUF58 domain-containing protein [Motiliproteus sp.]
MAKRHYCVELSPVTQSISFQQIDEYQVEGAFTNLSQLVSLHRFCADFRLGRRQLGAASQAGEWKTRSRGRGIDFEEVRLYQPGDDIRSIDWRVTARSQQTHTRVYREERERPVILAADMRSSMFFGSQHCFKSVQSAALISSLAWGALANRDRVGGLVFGDQEHRDIRPKRSKHNVLELIRQLDQYSHLLSSPCDPISEQEGPSHSRSMASMLEKLQHVCKPGTAVCISSDFHDFDDHCRKRLFQLARHTEVTLFMISDPLEQQIAARGRFWVTDGVHRQQLSAASHHGEALRQRVQTLAQICAPLGIPLHPISTSDHLLRELRNLYGQQRKPVAAKRGGAGS